MTGGLCLNKKLLFAFSPPSLNIDLQSLQQGKHKNPALSQNRERANSTIYFCATLQLPAPSLSLSLLCVNVFLNSGNNAAN